MVGSVAASVNSRERVARRTAQKFQDEEPAVRGGVWIVEWRTAMRRWGVAVGE
jgi:hypothetical protein